MARYKKTETSLLSEKRALASANKRRIVIYPSVRNLSIFLGMCFEKSQKKGSFAHDWFVQSINRLSDAKKQYYLDLYKTLSEDQIKKIGMKGEDDGC